MGRKGSPFVQGRGMGRKGSPFVQAREMGRKSSPFVKARRQQNTRVLTLTILGLVKTSNRICMCSRSASVSTM